MTTNKKVYKSKTGLQEFSSMNQARNDIASIRKGFIGIGILLSAVLLPLAAYLA
jgi:hypothetical protein